MHKVAIHLFVEFHDGCLVSAAVTVVGCTENRDDALFVGPAVAFCDKLVSTGDQLETIVAVELLRDVLAKDMTGTTRRGSPAGTLFGVRPEEIAHGAVVGDFLDTIKGADVIKSVDGRRETSMETEDLVLNESGKRKVIKQVSEALPDVWGVVLSETLVVESIDLSDLSTLVISTEDGETIRISHLEGDQEGDSLNGIVTAVNIVSHEEIVGVWEVSSNLEELLKIVELAVNVSTHCDWGADRLDV